MIPFINSVSWQFVALALVVIAGAAGAYITYSVGKGSEDARQKRHDENMLSTETSHREKMAKLNPALPGEGRAMLAKATTVQASGGDAVDD